MAERFVRKLIAVETRLGFLYVPAAFVEMMPSRGGKTVVVTDGDHRSLTYSAEHRRIFGLTTWYKKLGLKAGDQVLVEKKSDKIWLSATKDVDEIREEEGEREPQDLSGLSSQAKGDIVEDRIKEMVLLQSQGLLSVYRPVTDTQGIDLVVVRNGFFQPLFIQVKGRYNVEKAGHFLMDINQKTFVVHGSFFVIGASFNPGRLELDDHILLVPSHEIPKGAAKLKSGKREVFRVQSKLNPDSQGRWAKFVIAKSDLVSQLMDKFEEMEKYFK
jgi:hypothetical protein